MRVSVIVPTLNEEGYLASTLWSVLAQPGEKECIVVDGGSGDGTARVVAGWDGAVKWLESPPGRANQMNAGASHAAGETLLFLHADTCLAPGALDALRAVLTSAGMVGGTFTLTFDRKHPVLDFYSRITRIPGRLLHYGDQGIFVRRRVFETMGGFRPLPLMEDADFTKRMRRYGKAALVPLAVTTSARRFERNGILRQELRNVALVALFELGVDASRLAKWYR